MIACGPRSNEHASLEICVPTALPLHMRAKIREVRAVETDPAHRGKGHARDLMQRICTSADLSDTWLMVKVEPGDLGTDKVRLARWYMSHGFTPIQSEPAILMVRQSLQARA